MNCASCNKCGAALVLRKGRHGPFYACPNSRPGNNHGTRSVVVQWALSQIEALNEEKPRGATAPV